MWFTTTASAIITLVIRGMSILIVSSELISLPTEHLILCKVLICLCNLCCFATILWVIRKHKSNRRWTHKKLF